MSILHITNGESTGGTLRETGLGGPVVCWNDVLHEGPVYALPLRELSEQRAQFIAGSGWAPIEEVRRSFAERDAAVEAFADHEEVCLWFEHDLYDQLQLLQLLDWFGGRALGATRLMMICLNDHPEVKPFHGLGQLDAAQLNALYPQRVPVTPAQMATAQAVWRTFTSPSPETWPNVLNKNLSALPFLQAAWRRMLEQFPSPVRGVNRTERHILEVAASVGPVSSVKAFGECASKEEAIFLGDTTFFGYVDGLAAAPGALLERTDEMRLTPLGDQVLAGREDWLAHHPIDRWYGGVHVQSANGPVFRWE